MTKIDIPLPDIVGTPYGGGFFAGTFLLNGQLHALIVSPKAEGETRAPFKDHNSTTEGARSLRDGMANSQAMIDGHHPAAAFCHDLKIGGFDDWYLPSRHEMALLAENLMPGAGYVPEQTAAEAFKVGGAEAFERNWYLTSTEFSAGYVWVQTFSSGYQTNGDVKDWSGLVRAVRKVPFSPSPLSTAASRAA